MRASWAHAEAALLPGARCKGGVAATDALLEVRGGEAACSCRAFVRPRATTPPAAVLVHFHGNAETVADAELHAAQLPPDVTLVAVDYAGYGFGDGTATIETLCSDAEEALRGLLLSRLERWGLAGLPVVVWGRSLGCVPAVHVASVLEERLAGVIVDSGVVDLAELARGFAQMGLLGAAQGLGDAPEPFGMLDKAASVTQLPLLVLLHQSLDE